MAQVQIQEEDLLLIHREGVDYKTPWTSVLNSIPQVNLDGVLTYKGVADGTAAEPDQVEGEIWLLQLESPAAGWVPGGAKTGDYLTYAADVAGSTAWRIVGNAAGVDFEELVTKDELESVQSDLLDRLDGKADKGDLDTTVGALETLAEKVGENTVAIDGLGTSLGELTQAHGETAAKLETLSSRVDDLESKEDANEENLEKIVEQVRGNTEEIAAIQLGLKGFGQGIEANHDLIEANKEAIEELQAVKPFDFASLDLLPVS